MNYGYLPNYDPKEADTPVITDLLKQRAKHLGDYLSPDGKQVCKRQFNKWLVRNSDGSGSWWETQDYPDGWIRL